MVRFCLFAASSLILGGWLFAIPLYSAEDCNLRQNRPQTKIFPTTPPPPLQKKIEDGKIARFRLRAASSLISGGWEFFDPQNPNHFTLIVFAGSKFVKERWCACLLHLYHNTTGK